MTGSPDLDDIWDVAWAEAVTAQTRKTDVTPEKWRSAGRVTKANPNKEDLAFWNIEGRAALEGYRDWLDSSGWQIAEYAGKPLVEFELNVMFGDIRVKGFADAVFATPDWIMVDYKTGSRAQAGPQQLALYAVMMQELGMPAPEWGAFYSTRKNALGPVENLTQWDKSWWDRQFALLAAAKESEIFLPNISDHCRGCGVRPYCFAVGGLQANLYDPDHPEYSSNSNTTERF